MMNYVNIYYVSLYILKLLLPPPPKCLRLKNFPPPKNMPSPKNLPPPKNIPPPKNLPPPDNMFPPKNMPLPFEFGFWFLENFRKERF